MTEFSPNVATLLNTTLQHTVPIGSNVANGTIAGADRASSLLASAGIDTVSPETLVFYLKSRLTYLDDQINDVFEREKKGQHVRSEVQAIQTLLASAEVDGDGPKATGKLSGAAIEEIKAHLDEIAQYDLELATDLQQKLYGEGQILHNATPLPPPTSTTGIAEGTRADGAPPVVTNTETEAATPDISFTKSQLDASKDYLSGVGKDLDSGSQMDMISLQQAMSARQTAWELSSRLMASISDSVKAIVSNIR